MTLKTARRLFALGLLAVPSGCTDGDAGLEGERQRSNQPPMLSAPVAAAAMAPATMRPATVSDLTGAWQMLVLPPNVADQVNTTSRFSEEQQYFLIMADGRIGQVLSPSQNMLRLDRSGLSAMFAREPNWDNWSLVDGTMTIVGPVVTGFRQRRDVWRVAAVATPGALLGLAVQPGDVTMDFVAADGSIDYRRVIRRLP